MKLDCVNGNIKLADIICFGIINSVQASTILNSSPGRGCVVLSTHGYSGTCRSHGSHFQPFHKVFG